MDVDKNLTFSFRNYGLYIFKEYVINYCGMKNIFENVYTYLNNIIQSYTECIIKLLNNNKKSCFVVSVL